MRKFKNTVTVSGRVSSIEEAYDYEDQKTGEVQKYFQIIVEVPRFSENYDEVPFIVSSKFMAHGAIVEDALLTVNGTIRTRNYEDDQNHKHTSVYGYADDVIVLTEEEFQALPEMNRVHLEGVLCKEPVFRSTNSGRLITDLMLANNRQCYRQSKNPVVNQVRRRKSYYIPCIAWGPNAKAAQKLKMGDTISLTGRFQSRKYRRKADLMQDIHIAYEVSILDYNIDNGQAAKAAASE